MSTLKTTNITHPSATSNNIVLASDGSATIPTLTTTTIQGTIKSGTAQNSTSGTSIDFTGIPSWVKRITVMFSDVSTTGTSHFLVRIGSGSFATTGYNSVGAGCINAASPLVASSTAGFLIVNDTAADQKSGAIIISLISTNNYISQHSMGGTGGRSVAWWGGGNVSLSGTLDRVRITTVNGTDTFDAGSINILYEG